MNAVLARLVDHWNQQHWAKKALKIGAAVSGAAMAVAAATSASDHHIRADGTKAPKGDRLEGDPGSIPVSDVGERKDAGEKTDPDSDSNDLDGSGIASR